jgi:Lysophospholipase
MKYNFSINTIPGNKIDLDLYSEAPSEPRSVVVIAHGFKGFKDWGFFPHAGDYFAHAGYHCVIFNFSHNGITPGNDIFDEPEKFADNTASLELSELIEVVRRVVSNEFCKFNGDLFIIGHSRGGGIAMLAAPHIAELTALGLWSAISYTDRFTERQKEVARSVGYLEVPNSRTGQILRMNRSFFEDIEANKEGSLSIVKTFSENRMFP